MKKYLYVLIAWMLPLCSIHAQAPVWNPDNGNGTFTNLLCGVIGLIRM